jgi:hypothetical protein
VVAVGVPVPILEVLGGLAVDEKVALGVAIQAAYDVEQSGLTTARGAQDGHELTLAKVNTDSVQRLDVGISDVIALLDVFELKHDSLRSGFDCTKLQFTAIAYHKYMNLS